MVRNEFISRHRYVFAGVLVSGLLLIPGVSWASNQFSDVPDSDWAHDSVDWLVSNSITNGCGDGSTFCPDEGVTRRQMAAFMNRLSDNLTPRSAFSSTNQLSEPSPPDTAEGVVGQFSLLETTITVPQRGVLTFSAGYDQWWDINGGSGLQYCAVMLDGTAVIGTARFTILSQANPEEDCETSGASIVDAGTYTVGLDVFNWITGNGIAGGSLSVTWIPLDGTGQAPSFAQVSSSEFGASTRGG